MIRFALVVGCLSLPAALAQEGGRFKVEEHALNAGGAPAGTTVVGARFRLQPASIGLGAGMHALGGVRFRGEAGFAAAYPPPGEVVELRLAADHQTLSWAPEPSTGTYNVYRDLLGALGGGGYGTCLESSIAGTSHLDPDSPAPATGYFYLVTAENRLAEEGTKGFASSGALRGNAAPCP